MACRPLPMTLLMAVPMLLIAATMAAQSINWPLAGCGATSRSTNRSAMILVLFARSAENVTEESRHDPSYFLNIVCTSVRNCAPNIAFRFLTVLSCATRAALLSDGSGDHALHHGLAD